MKKVILCVIVLAAMLSVAYATPFQTIGMLRTPDAYVLPHKAAEILLVGYYRDVVKPDYVVTPDRKRPEFVPYGILGVGLFDRAELAVFGGDEVFFMNLKIKLIQETNKIPQISAGMDNIFSPVDFHRAQDHTPTTDPGWEYADHPDKWAYEYYSPYLVGSKQVVFGGVNWMFNLGIGSNRFVGQDPDPRMTNGLFMSVELSPLKNLALQGEYSGHDVNVGMKYMYKNFGIRASVQNIDDYFKSNGYEENIRAAIGLSYLFDKYAEGKRVRPDLSEYAANVVTGDEVVINDVPDDNGTVAVGDNGTTSGDTGLTTGDTGTTVDTGTTSDTGTTTGDTGTTGNTTTVTGDTGTTTGDTGTTVTDVTVDTGTVTTGDTVDDGTTITLNNPSDTLANPGVVVTQTNYKELSPEVKDLLAELRNLREQRMKAQKALEDLRKWLQEQKK